MRKRPLGKTGLEISELIIGGGFVGGLLIHGSEENKKKLLQRAHQVGINWIDTAPSYGKGMSEYEIGRLLNELELRDQFHISTKVGLDVDDLDNIEGQIRASLEKSFTRLQCDYVDVLQLHNELDPEVVSFYHLFRPGGICATFNKLKDEGLVGHVGFTALGDPALCLELINSGRMETAQVYFNLINPSAGLTVPDNWSSTNFKGILRACHDKGMGTIAIRIFAGGILATDQRHGREIPLTPNADVETETERARKIFARLNGDYGRRAQAALRFALGNDYVTCVALGLAEPAHLELALQAYRMGPLPLSAIAALSELWINDYQIDVEEDAEDAF